MGKLDDLIAQLRNPGEDGLPETIYDDITQTYSDETEGWTAKSGEYEEAAKANASEISRLKSLLFDKSMETPVDGGNGSNSDEDEPDTDDADDKFGIDALFKPKD